MSAAAPSRHFASDNNAGIIPEAWAALVEANDGNHSSAYGDDAWTARAEAEMRRVFEHEELEVFFVFNGTASNSLALASLCDSMHAVVCHESSHIMTDECGAPGFFRHGLTLVPVAGENGKISPTAVRAAVAARNSVHTAEVRALSLTQCTELGTVYQAGELAALRETASALNLRLHMDGARFANAVAALGVSPAEASWRAGVEVLSFGATKNGLAAGEAVVFFDPAVAANFKRRKKQAGQLASKMRFVAAPWVGFLRDDAWLRHARHANAMAARLEQAIGALPGVRIPYPREANAVFVHLPRPAVEALWKIGWRFYDDVDPRGAVRLMCAWDTRAGDVDAFVADLGKLLGSETGHLTGQRE